MRIKGAGRSGADDKHKYKRTQAKTQDLQPQSQIQQEKLYTPLLQEQRKIILEQLRQHYQQILPKHLKLLRLMTQVDLLHKHTLMLMVKKCTLSQSQETT